MVFYNFVWNDIVFYDMIRNSMLKYFIITNDKNIIWYDTILYYEMWHCIINVVSYDTTLYHITRYSIKSNQIKQDYIIKYYLTWYNTMTQQYHIYTKSYMIQHNIISYGITFLYSASNRPKNPTRSYAYKIARISVHQLFDYQKNFSFTFICYK